MSHADTSWMDDAACIKGKHKTSVFFPTKQAGHETPEYKKALAKALRICAGCPVRDECEQYAVDEGLEFGVWGMKTAEQRIKERQARNLNHPKQPPRCGTEAGYRQHLRLDEPKCHDCVLAHREVVNGTARKRRERRRSTAA